MSIKEIHRFIEIRSGFLNQILQFTEELKLYLMLECNDFVLEEMLIFNLLTVVEKMEVLQIFLIITL